MNAPVELPDRLVLFDGVCAVCDAGMTWLIDHDRDRVLRYAPLQGETARQVLLRHPELPSGIDSIVFVDRTGPVPTVSWHSDALLDIAAHLPAPWRWATALRVLPRPMRDLAYRAFAAVRYRVFGRVDHCRLADEGEAALLLP